MSKCKVCNKKDKKYKVLQKVNNAGVCEICHPAELGCNLNDACVCPPIGEPCKLTMLAPVVYDECGINFCKTIDDLAAILDDHCHDEDQLIIITDDPIDFDDVTAIDAQVLDINFNVKEDTVRTLDRRPNCVRVKLENIYVTFLIRFLDSRCDVVGEAILVSKYLPEHEECPCYDDDTNRPFAVDLYCPYGVHRRGESYKDDIQYIGFYNNNNTMKQGIVAQALAKVVAFDPDELAISLGVTLYIKVVYFVQYKVAHEGLAVPPKCIAVEEELADACADFVEGNLLEQSIQPLEVAVPSKTVPPCFTPVVDPTPAEKEKPHHHHHHR